MEGKLIKTFFDGWTNYYLKNDEDRTIATTAKDYNRKGVHKLSLKNCEAITNGYDLDELAFQSSMSDEKEHSDMYRYIAKKFFKLGAEAILEILDDKKFSENDLDNFRKFQIQEQNFSKSCLDVWLKSQQQTEWDVKIVMEYIGECNGNNNDGCFQDSPGHNCGCFVRKPKLDTNGCLILKRK